MRAAIMGVGAMGTIVGALIVRSGQTIDLIDVNEEHVKALNESGARVCGKMEFTVPVRALTPAQMTGEYDFFLYMVKATADSKALETVNKHLKPDGFVVTLQNGIPEERVAAVIGPRRTLGGAISWGATLIEPGVSMLTSEPDNMNYDIGEIDGTKTIRLNRIINLLKPAGYPAATDNLIGARWAKLAINATFSGVSTVMGGTYGDILDNRKALVAAAHIGREAIRIMKAAGVTPEPIQGFDIRMLDFNSLAEMETKLPIYGIAFRPHRAIKGSMLYDLEQGRPCEIDAINGVVKAWGERFKVDTPVNDQVVNIIRGIEAGRLRPDINNLESVIIPELPVC